MDGITTQTWGDGPPDIVMLHDGLGSITQWGDVPARIAADTGATVMAYDRPGHGRSEPVPDGPWPTEWLRHNAELLDELLAQHGAEQPMLVGHSDGGSIALLHAARSAAERPVSAVLSIAAHTFVEPICSGAIIDMRAKSDRLVTGLGRNHLHPTELFAAWSGVWVSDEFQSWDVRSELSAITAPTIVAQGTDDEYATDAMVYDTVAAIGDNATAHFIAGRGHLVHYEDPDPVVALAVDLWHRRDRAASTRPA
ncbi:MAG: alpha/beta hydrolase [Ilumatobacter sp.]|uniref:alpha/beta fold hydrolase n=1 Tax=Ilumatobacter sp. TaxID=1967498 RepID=UPI003C73318D